MRIIKRIGGRALDAMAPGRHPTDKAPPDENPVRIPLPDMQLDCFANFAEYVAYRDSSHETFAARIQYENSLLTGAEEVVVVGYCALCRQQSAFLVDYQYCYTLEDGTRLPNWRERLVCQGCGLNNRQRGMIHFLRTKLDSIANPSVYVTEQMTPFFLALQKRIPDLVGSEYLRDETPRGTYNARGIRHEDLTDLSFSDATFDLICTGDVLEHIPNVQAAVCECFRCLKPGGTLLVSVPFLRDEPNTLVRARLCPDGSVEHLLAPEYHGDPLDAEGALCFYHFGWDFLDILRDAGGGDAEVCFYWSKTTGYLGLSQLLIVGQKA